MLTFHINVIVKLVKIFVIYTYIFYNTTFLAQKIHLIQLRHVKGHKIRITLGQIIWHWTCLVFMMSPLKKTTAKVYFLQYDICISQHYTCYCSRTFPHSYAKLRSPFSIETHFCEIYNIFKFFYRIKQVFTKNPYMFLKIY